MREDGKEGREGGREDGNKCRREGGREGREGRECLMDFPLECPLECARCPLSASLRAP